ncbi:hypothetical protein [Nocardia bhagyanarayanae]|uniref:Type VII secretion system (Wss) protein ESAT-6 n=1 Tax=Nocardia bhagyanarayanae TaxID=1215925 RepID=A0A543EWD4_9NOCA|nr:hypothetical protein [Nocardia bhagyanarayanae]TQM25881.1 hypothetical protein FB390_6049 [Nocardia bhagyanarayanae]
MSTTIGDWLNEHTAGFDDQPKPDNPLIAEGTDYREEYFQEDVFWLSNVGLEKDEETGVPGVLDGTIAGDAWEAYSNLRNGDTFSAITGGISAGVTVADAFYDPFGFVGDQIAGWMLTHCEPYRKILDALAGNDEMVGAYAETWSNIAQELTTMSQDWKKGVEKDIATWTGSAGDAYRNRATALIDQILGAGGVAASLGETMKTASEIVKAFRKMIQDICTSLAGALIGYTIELALTLGAGSFHVISAVMARFARDSIKISTLLADMAKAFYDLNTLSQAVTGVINALLGQENQPQQPA